MFENDKDAIIWNTESEDNTNESNPMMYLFSSFMKQENQQYISLPGPQVLSVIWVNNNMTTLNNNVNL